MDASSQSRVTAGCVAVCPKACDECAPSESLVVGRKKALLTGICGSKTASKEYPKLRGSHNDVFSVRDLLIDCYGYTADNITILIDDGVPGHVQPTRANILKAIETLVKDAKAGDHFCFYYCGHSTQVKNRSNSEEDGMDECIIPCDGEAKMIVDNVRPPSSSSERRLTTTSSEHAGINAALVAPLPAGSYLVAVLDTCHSGSLLDLKHSWCNRVIVPWIPRGKRNSEEIRHRVATSLTSPLICSPARRPHLLAIKHLSSVSTPGRKVDFGGPSRPPPRRSSTRLLARQNEINMNLMCRAQAPNTGSVPPVTGARRASTAHSRTSPTARVLSLSPQLPPRGKTPCSVCRGRHTHWRRTERRAPRVAGKFWVLSEEEQRCESPVAMFECNGWCRDLPVEILRCDPHQSLKDVLVHISHAMYTNAHIRHTKARAYKNRHKQFLANITENISKLQRTMSLVHPDLPPTIAVSPTFPVPRKPSFVARRMDDVKRLKQLLIELARAKSVIWIVSRTRS
ncbi:caspase domain-containing protein [Mycena leptocephala]|nr:caspase domain-containing protein [Mycena leptocephala]